MPTYKRETSSLERRIAQHTFTHASLTNGNHPKFRAPDSEFLFIEMGTLKFYD